MKKYQITICDACYRLEAGMCHEPGCVFIRRTRGEVSEYLDMLMLRPIVDGDQLDLSKEEGLLK